MDPAADSHAVAVKDIIRYAGVMGLVAIVGIMLLAFALVTGWQPHGASGPVQKELSLVLLGALIPVPGAVISGMFGLLGRTGRDPAGPAPGPFNPYPRVTPRE